MGLGWGRLGRSENIRNPFIGIDDNFRFRQNEGGQGGAFNNREWFSGDEISIFSGLEYYAYKHGLIFKLEYDTTNPDLGNENKKLQVDSRFNFGIHRPINENLDVGVSFERGNQWRISFAIKSDYGRRPLVQKNDPPKNIVRLNKRQLENINKDKSVFYRSLNKSLREESIFIQSATINDDSAEVLVAQNRFRSFPRAIGRTARMVSALSPQKIEEIRIIPMNADAELYEVKLNRGYFDRVDEEKISTKELLNVSEVNEVDPSKYINSEFIPKIKFQSFSSICHLLLDIRLEVLKLFI